MSNDVASLGQRAPGHRATKVAAGFFDLTTWVSGLNGSMRSKQRVYVIIRSPCVVTGVTTCIGGGIIRFGQLRSTDCRHTVCRHLNGLTAVGNDVARFSPDCMHAATNREVPTINR
jgi:hypothetical protein